MGSSQSSRISTYDHYVQVYLDEIGRHPLLTAQDERDTLETLISQRRKIIVALLRSSRGAAIIREWADASEAGEVSDWFDVHATDRERYSFIRDHIQDILSTPVTERSISALSELPIVWALILREMGDWGKLNLLHRPDVQDMVHYCRAETALRRATAARTKLIESNLRLVVSIAKLYCLDHESLLDVIQEGNCGLMRAVDKLDNQHDVKLCTYASYWIRQAIQRSKSRGHAVWLPQDRRAQLRELEESMGAIEQTELRRANLTEAADHLGIDEQDAQEIWAAGRRPSSIDQLENPNAESVLISEQDEPSEADAKQHLVGCVRQALDSLDDQEARILSLRYGLDGSEPSQSLRAVGERLNVSREWVRKLEKRAVTKLKMASCFDTYHD